MIRPRSHKAGKAESLFGDILKPFFDSIGHEPPRLQRADAAETPLIADTMVDDWRGCNGPLSAARTRSKNSKPFRRRTTVKSVTDLPIGACHSALIAAGMIPVG
jgi:hypothetical protein